MSYFPVNVEHTMAQTSQITQAKEVRVDAEYTQYLPKNWSYLVPIQIYEATNDWLSVICGTVDPVFQSALLGQCYLWHHGCSTSLCPGGTVLSVA